MQVLVGHATEGTDAISKTFKAETTSASIKTETDTERTWSTIFRRRPIWRSGGKRVPVGSTDITRILEL